MTLLTAFALALLLPQGGSSEIPFEPIRPAAGEASAPPTALQGIWVSRGYGWLVEIGEERIRAFDHSLAGTLEQAGDPIMLIEGVQHRFVGDALQITGIPGSSSVYTWDRLPEIPPSVAHPPTADPLSVFDYFWSVMDIHYAFFEERGIDWNARRAEYRPRIEAETSEGELWEILCAMLTGLNDAHMSLNATVDGVESTFVDGGCRELDPALEAAFQSQDRYSPLPRYRSWWHRRYRNIIKEEILGGVFHQDADEQVLWGRLGPLGYVNVFGMGGFSDNEDEDDMLAEVAAVHQVMSKILTELADCDGIILDITMNSGGYEEVQMAISSHFVDERRIGFRKIPLDVQGSKTVEPQSFYLFPAAGKRYLGPVSLVTSDYTVSAGEDFTMAMRQLPHVTHRGSRTRGAISDILNKRLPNGWELALSNEAYLDVDGHCWEAKGISPQVSVPVFTREDIEYAHHDAILEIADAMLAFEDE